MKQKRPFRRHYCCFMVENEVESHVNFSPQRVVKLATLFCETRA